MKRMKGQNGYMKYILILLIPFLLLVTIFWYLDRELYLSCIKEDFYLCLNSEKYTSADGSFSMRRYRYYPFISLSGQKLKNDYLYEPDYLEEIRFSNEGADRGLGTILEQEDYPYGNVTDVAKDKFALYDAAPKIEYRKIGGEDAVCGEIPVQPHSFSVNEKRCYIIYDKKLYTITFYTDIGTIKLKREFYDKADNIILSTFRFH